jgi:hypothetical protein
MGNKFLVIILFFSLFTVSPVFADSCDEWNNLEVPTMLGGIWTALSEKFPFSIIVFAGQILDEFSSISPTSPAGIELDVLHTTITPFWFIGSSSIADGVFLGIRLLILIVTIFSIVKHVIEAIL